MYVSFCLLISRPLVEVLQFNMLDCREGDGRMVACEHEEKNDAGLIHAGLKRLAQPSIR